MGLLIVKCLTLTQPWATLVMLREKRFETRPRLYKHRGDLYIHASGELDLQAWFDPIFREALAKHGITTSDQIPLGKVLGKVNVVDGCHFVDQPWPQCLPITWWGSGGKNEHHFGNYAAGRGGLRFEDVWPFAEPVKARGWNGLWNWTLPEEGVTYAQSA